jgi:hypothetical protein
VLCRKKQNGIDFFISAYYNNGNIYLLTENVLLHESPAFFQKQLNVVFLFSVAIFMIELKDHKSTKKPQCIEREWCILLKKNVYFKARMK